MADFRLCLLRNLENYERVLALERKLKINDGDVDDDNGHDRKRSTRASTTTKK